MSFKYFNWNFLSISLLIIICIISKDVGRIENEEIRTTYGLNLIGQMAFDVRLNHINTIDETYNTQTLNKLQKWTSKRDDIDTLIIEKKDRQKLIEDDIEIHYDKTETVLCADYIDEEYEDTVGYFKPNKKK